jgi:hypothetical protein
LSKKILSLPCPQFVTWRTHPRLAIAMNETGRACDRRLDYQSILSETIPPKKILPVLAFLIK